MKSKVTALAFVAFMFVAGSARAADLWVDQGAGLDTNPCTMASPCKTIAYALSIAIPGDNIILVGGNTWNEGNLNITTELLTIKSSTNYGIDPGGVRGLEAIVDGTGGGFDYIFSIQADNVTIDGLDILGDDDTFTGIKVFGDYDNWTIANNKIHGMANDNPSSSLQALSFGIWAIGGNAGSEGDFTGVNIYRNHIYDLGGFNVPSPAFNVTAGAGIYMESVVGDADACAATSGFEGEPVDTDCGAWVHENHIFEMFDEGKNVAAQSAPVNDPTGHQTNHGVIFPQDQNDDRPNRGVMLEDNLYNTDPPAYWGGGRNYSMDIAVTIATGGSNVEEPNANFETTDAGFEVDLFVLNVTRAADVNELILVDFYKSLKPDVLGAGTDAYFRTKLLAENNSAEDATIVALLEGSTSDKLRMEVFAQGESVSYRVSLDSDGNLNVREGARLLYADPLYAPGGTPTKGVAVLLLNGTDGDDLLTIDFNNGNPTPYGVEGNCEVLAYVVSGDCGIQFDGADGFDKIVMRGDEQLDDEAIVMGHGVNANASAEGSGTIIFEPTSFSDITSVPVTSTMVNFLNIEPIDDILIVNGTFAIQAPDDTDNEINFIDGPIVFGEPTYQVNSGSDATFEKVNLRNKKEVRLYGANEPTTNGLDIFTVFTVNNDADLDFPNLLQDLRLYGGHGGGATDDDYFVVRPSTDFAVSVDGNNQPNADWAFLDCAAIAVACDPALLTTPSGTISLTGYEDFTWTNIESTAADLGANDVSITKSVDVFGDAHPGDEIEFTVTVENVTGAGSFSLVALPVWVTDVVDHRFSLIEQSVVVDEGTVDITDNRSLLWRLDEDTAFNDTETATMTYTVIVNTLITTNDITNWASILNPDFDLTYNYDSEDVELETVFGFPIKAEIQSSLFYPTEAGPRYIVGLYQGAVDPNVYNVGSVLCRVPEQNKEVGWDGGLGNLWYSCSEGLPAKDGIYSPLTVTDMLLAQNGRIWLTTWGFGGLYYSDDGGKSWTDAMLDISGSFTNGPDGLPDGVAQVYAIAEDIIGTLYISANNGDIYRSFDSGVTWQKAKQLPQGSATTPWSLLADPTQPGTVFAGTFGFKMYKTENFGETWTETAGTGLKEGHIFDLAFDPISGNLFAGTARGVFYSADGGDTWTGLNNAFPEPNQPPEIRHISFDEDGQLYVGTWGQGVWFSSNWQALNLGEFALKGVNVSNMGLIGDKLYAIDGTGNTFLISTPQFSVDAQENPAAEVPMDFVLDQNYPNPFNPTTTIAFALPAAQDINLSVFDVLGRKVQTLVDGRMPAGQHRVTFQASDLPSGMYLYRLVTPQGMKSQTMILLK